MTHKTAFTITDFVILKVVKKEKNNKFFRKMIIFSCLCKILQMQTSNLAICLSIYAGICCMLMRIARVDLQPIQKTPKQTDKTKNTGNYISLYINLINNSNVY